MIDFTINAYCLYLDAILNSYPDIITFEEYFRHGQDYDTFCIIRHDVDRNPMNALHMAEIENKLGITSTYYFRSKRHTFKPNIIKKIVRMGHEVGYHYESLSDAKGNIKKAILDFEGNLEKFNEIIKVTTISMHGRPFSRYDNRDIWKNPKFHKLLYEKYGILGEVYFDIDYKKILYVTDTGRNWQINVSNIRDRVDSDIKKDGFKSGNELFRYLSAQPHPKLIFQMHPERWTKNLHSFFINTLTDKAVNITKKVLWGNE